MPAAIMLHTADPKDAILAELGDISAIEIFNTQVLCAIYRRPEKTKGGILLPGSNLDEDKYQSKVGLIVAAGPKAFDSKSEWFSDIAINVHDWVVLKPSDGWNVTVKNPKGGEVLCRMINDVDIKGRVSHPDVIW